MARARVQFFSISLDGFGTGDGQSRDLHFGHAGERLHQWMFETRRWHEMVGEPGGTGGIDDAFAGDELAETQLRLRFSDAWHGFCVDLVAQSARNGVIAPETAGRGVESRARHADERSGCHRCGGAGVRGASATRQDSRRERTHARAAR